MKVKDIFSRIILRSGQFIIKRSNVEIDIDSFRMLVEDALAIYTKASPYVKEYHIRMTARRFTFTEDYDEELKQIPNWVSEATPVLGGANPLYSPYGSFGATQDLVGDSGEPLQALWEYRKPILTVNFSGDWDIECCFHHRVIEGVDSITGAQEYSVPTIDITDTVFFQLIQGMFLQGIGRSRRAFTLNDLPIVMDADTLASEGEALIEKAMENMQNIQKIYTVMGV